MDYYKIGQRIRKYRKAMNFSQENLAEKVGISATHMSHIETGNTKLSLPVFVAIAQALSVQTDELLFDVPELNKTLIKNAVCELFDSCSSSEAYFLADVLKATKTSLEKYYE